VIAAAAIGLLVAYLPGFVLGWTVPSGRDRWLVWAAAPALTLGLVTLSMAWLPRMGLPNGVVAVMVSELVLGTFAVVTARLVSRRRHRSRDSDATQVGQGEEPSAARQSRTRPLLEVVSVGLPSLVTVVYGWLVLGRFHASPGWDAMNHAFLTRRILDTGSTAIRDACATGSSDPAVACQIYPLATNVTWAQAAQFSGGRISEAMTAWVIVIAPLALVVGVYACVRAFGVHPLIAGCAATAPTFVGPVWTAMLIGRPTQQLGPALVPAIALLVVGALRGSRPWRLGALSGLAGAGLVMSHTYDALVVPLLGLGLLLAFGVAKLRLTTMVRAAVSLLVMAAITTAPFLPRLAGAQETLAQTPPRYVGQLGEAAYYWLVDPMRYVLLGYPAPESKYDFPLDELQVRIALWATVIALLASPFCLVIKRLRWARPWLVMWLVLTALGIWTSVDDSPTPQHIAGLWYGTRDRLRAMMLADYGLLAVVGACVIGIAAARLYRLAARRRAGVTGSSAPQRVAAIGLLVVLGLTAIVPSTWRPLHNDLARRTPKSDAYPRVFEWLATNTPRGEVAAYNTNREFLTWAYADYGVGLLFGLTPHTEPDSRENYAQRRQAWNWLVDNKKSAPSGCLVQKFKVRYVVTSTSHIPGPWAVIYDRKRLAKSPNLAPVHKDGPITVYQVTPRGRACDPSS
jgi:hypothetical protein